MAEPTIFDKIVSGDIPSFKVWEDAAYLAFLSLWGNTSGFTVVVPKTNPGGNFLSVDDTAYTDLLLAAKKVAALLQKALGVERVGLVIEGEGVPHLHVKLIPMHNLGAHPNHSEYYESYPGYLTTIDGPRMSDEQLSDIQHKIQEAAR